MMFTMRDYLPFRCRLPMPLRYAIYLLILFFIIVLLLIDIFGQFADEEVDVAPLQASNECLNLSSKVLVIGAGTAGLYAGYALQHMNIDFQILEASSIHGGRVKLLDNFADFPIDLGAEWVHVRPNVLDDLLLVPDDGKQTSALDRYQQITYNPRTYAVSFNGRTHRRDFLRYFYSEYKFYNTTWYQYIDGEIARFVRDKILYDTVVARIDFSGDGVEVIADDGRVFNGDKAIVAVPLTPLQDGDISFIPELPVRIQEQLMEGELMNGFKVFFEFSERFYPDTTLPYSVWDYLFVADGLFDYFDTGFGKDYSHRHFLTVLGTGPVADSILRQSPNDDSLVDDATLVQRVLRELDRMFDGKASKYHIKNHVQNWSLEPYIRGTWSYGVPNPEVLINGVDDKLYFVGEHVAEWAGTVHGAALSARQAVDRMMNYC